MLNKRFTVLVAAAVSLPVTGSVFAASYQRIDGTIVDPIRDVSGNVHLYWTDLAPNADLSFAVLSNADLSNADLGNANLHYANLGDANLSGANLSGANLDFADLGGANLSGADLSAANLAYSFGGAFYSPDTNFSATGFEPDAAGWTLVVPQPSAMAMGLLALGGLISRRRR